MQRRRLLPVLAVVLLASSSVVLSGCSNFFAGTTQLTASYDATASTSSAYSVNVTASSGKGLGFCISSINYQWSDEATEHQGWASAGLPQCLMSVQRVLKVPTRAGGGTLRVHVVALDSVPLWPDRDDTWSAPIVIPAAASATPGSTTTTPLAAVLFARQSPTYSGGTIIDARQSTGTAPLSYSWSAGCNDTTGLNVGTARVISGFPRTCTVQVTDGTGATASASVALTVDADITRNGGISFPSGTQAEIASATKFGVPFSLESELACVALDGGTAFRTFVAIGTGAAGSLTGRVSLTALTPGIHRISAALFTDPLNANGPWNDAKCASITSPATTAGYIQTVSALYSVAADGSVSARRGGRATTAFIAPSSLRFVSTKTITEGTVDKLGAIGGATASGTFSWATPKASKGIKRPAGAGDLAKGTYVMRSISMSPGTKTGASTLLLGTGKVLLRGVSGTLACGTISGTFGSSTLMLAGGTGTARTLAGVVTGKPMGYVFPKPPKKPTKKPSNKSKPVKVKPVKAAGTATLQTSAKATALPSACQALVQYLPQ